MEDRVFKEILVADDEPGVRNTIAYQLNKNGYVVHTAEDGDKALEFLKSHPVDLVISDIRMPVMDGLTLLTKMREEGILCSVIMMSAFGTFDSVIEAMKKGAYDYIHKPYSSEELMLIVRKAEERERLKRENIELRRAIMRGPTRYDLITDNRRMTEILKLVRKVADYNSTVLILGESGTGKELIARALHENSPRKDKPFIAINCGAIPETLIESELFGYVKGAFTDARADKPGLFEEADGGYLFLDEIGDLPLQMQVKLLRVLQDGEIRRVGGTKSVKVDVRVVAATAHDLSELVKEGRFREDLFYRLNVVAIALPPLRERKDDIPRLFEHFRKKFNLKLGSNVTAASPEAMDCLINYFWPGNVRELENVIERAMILSEGSEIKPSDLPSKVTSKAEENITIPQDDLSIPKASAAIEKILITKALSQTGGNRTAAAKLLEISHRALLYKIKEYGIDL